MILAEIFLGSAVAALVISLFAALCFAEDFHKSTNDPQGKP